MLDNCGRKIDYMRISVTDRCNLRCVYCMPHEGVKNIVHSEILTFEEVLRVVQSAARLGVDKIKVTGGEPLVRKGAVDLVRCIKETDGISKVTLTTNGLLFNAYADGLFKARLDGVNFSLDSRDAGVYSKITRVDAFGEVMQAIENAVRLGFKTKINCVPLKGINEGSLVDLAGMAKKMPVDVRFIELMPLGLGAEFKPIANAEVLNLLTRAYGDPMPSKTTHGNGPAKYYDFSGFNGSIGFISALSDLFCRDCNRIRLTSDGFLKTCLCSNQGVALKPLLRWGIGSAELSEVIRRAIEAKPERHHLNEDSKTLGNKKMFRIGG